MLKRQIWGLEWRPMQTQRWYKNQTVIKHHPKLQNDQTISKRSFLSSSPGFRCPSGFFTEPGAEFLSHSTASWLTVQSHSSWIVFALLNFKAQMAPFSKGTCWKNNLLPWGTVTSFLVLNNSLAFWSSRKQSKRQWSTSPWRTVILAAGIGLHVRSSITGDTPTTGRESSGNPVLSGTELKDYVLRAPLFWDPIFISFFSTPKFSEWQRLGHPVLCYQLWN